MKWIMSKFFGTEEQENQTFIWGCNLVSFGLLWYGANFSIALGVFFVTTAMMTRIRADL